MSTLKTNTLTGTTSAGSIVVTGEGGSTTTNLQQGLAKAFGVRDMTNDTTPDSFNIASFTDRGTSCLFGNYTNNMNSASHTVVGTSSPVQEGSMGTNNYNRYVIASSDTTARYSENSRLVSDNSQADDPYIAAIVHGDLA